ncbi:MAG: hypothetical protein K0R99_4625 [Microbacterium sp.]|nr:hypothetical protein [Microbacterium sp.]
MIRKCPKTASAGRGMRQSCRNRRIGEVEIRGIAGVANAEVNDNCATRINAGRDPLKTLGSLWRRMGDSNPRGLAPNTLSKRAP